VAITERHACETSSECRTKYGLHAPSREDGADLTWQLVLQTVTSSVWMEEFFAVVLVYRD
jgi:hypothetical protein